VRKLYYSFPMEDGEQDKRSFEAAMSEMESRAASAIQTLKEHEAITGQVKLDLAAFVALMYTRVPAFRENMQKIWGRWADLVLVGFASDEDRCRVLLDEIQAGKPAGVPVTPKDLKDAILQGRVQTLLSHPSTLSFVIDFAGRMAQGLVQMEWVLVAASPGTEYVTSDNPVCREAPARDERSAWNPGLGLASVEVTFPITREFALLASWQPFTRRHLVASPAAVREVNRRTVMSAQRFVYSPGKSVGLLRLVKKHSKRKPEVQLATDWEAGGATLRITTPSLAISSLVSMLAGKRPHSNVHSGGHEHE
jgi:hypothetical protein